MPKKKDFVAHFKKILDDKQFVIPMRNRKVFAFRDNADYLCKSLKALAKEAVRCRKRYDCMIPLDWEYVLSCLLSAITEIRASEPLRICQDCTKALNPRCQCGGKGWLCEKDKAITRPEITSLDQTDGEQSPTPQPSELPPTT